MSSTPASLKFRADAFEAMSLEFDVPAGSGPTSDWKVLSPEPPQPSLGFVYLDLNHWIGLAKARRGRPARDVDVDVLAELRTAVEGGEIAVPLSSSLYMEVAKVSSLRQRTDLADVMGEVSGFAAIAGPADILREEFERALNARRGRPAFPYRAKRFGFGFGYALGVPGAGYGEFDTSDLSSDEADELFVESLGVTVAQAQAELSLLTEYMVLRGPGNQVPAGYKIGPVTAIAASRAERERELADQLRRDPRWKSRLDEIVAARSLYFELGGQLPDLLDRSGLTMEAFFGWDKSRLLDFLDDLPSFTVLSALDEQQHRNADYEWSQNDVYDRDALRVAVPYCDVVVADKHAATLLRRAGSDARHSTTILHDLADLPDTLASLREYQRS